MNEQPPRCASGKCGPRRLGPLNQSDMRGRQIEFVVKFPDGTYSDPAPLSEIQALAEKSGGQPRARARTRVDPGQK